jgi:hypothetical protein
MNIEQLKVIYEKMSATATEAGSFNQLLQEAVLLLLQQQINKPLSEDLVAQ